MKPIQKVYCTLQFIDSLLPYYSKDKNLKFDQKIGFDVVNAILEKLCKKLYIDATQNEINKLLVSGHPLIKRMLKKEDRSIEAAKNWKEDKNLLENVSDEVFFVHQGYIENIKEFRNQYGCLIIDTSESSLHALRLLENKRGTICIVPKKWPLTTILDSTKYQKSWIEAIHGRPLVPCNSMVINDNYIFHNIDNRKQRGLLTIIKSIVKDGSKLDPKVPFHLAIFSCIDSRAGKPQITKEKAMSLIKEIKAFCPDVNMKIAIILHGYKDITHDREILTNYHRLFTGKGFNIIDDKIANVSDEKGIIEIAKGHIEPVFHSLVTTDQNQFYTKELQVQTLLWLRNIYYNKAIGSNGSFKVGDDFQHRLLSINILRD